MQLDQTCLGSVCLWVLWLSYGQAIQVRVHLTCVNKPISTGTS